MASWRVGDHGQKTYWRHDMPRETKKNRMMVACRPAKDAARQHSYPKNLIGHPVRNWMNHGTMTLLNHCHEGWFTQLICFFFKSFGGGCDFLPPTLSGGGAGVHSRKNQGAGRADGPFVGVITIINSWSASSSPSPSPSSSS